MYKMWLTVPLAVSFLVPKTVFSNDDSVLLDTLVVTGTRTERRLLDVPVRTEVITRQDIEKTHARDLAEALRHQPGVLLKDIHGKSGTEIWLQGLDSDRVLVLIDGRPVSASTGSTVDLSQISIADVERVEIVKGAVSALYGSSAMGGVVNVILTKADDPLAAQLQLDIGSYGDKSVQGKTGLDTRHLNSTASVSRANYAASISLDVRDTDGFDLDNSTHNFEGDRGTKLNLMADVSWFLSDTASLSYSASWYQEDIDRDFSTFAPGHGDILKIDAEYAARLTNTVSWEKDFLNGVEINGYLLNESFDNTTKQDVVATPEVDQKRQANIDTWKSELQINLPYGDSHNVTLGAVVFEASLKQIQERVEGSQTIRIDEITPGANHQSIEMFAQDNVFIGEQWEIIPGVRFQDDSDFGSHVAPKINILYIPSILSSLNPRIRFGLGSGYRVPNLKERYFLFDHSANGYVVFGNPELLPESSDSVQLGFETSISQSARGEISVFYNRFQDLITTSEDTGESEEQQLQVFRYNNIAAATTQGFDLNFTHSINSILSYEVAYTWLESRDQATGLSLTRRPEHQFIVGFDYELSSSGSLVSVKAAWQSKEFVDTDNQIRSPAYTSLDVKFNQAVDESISWFVGVNNVLDEHLNPVNAGSDFRPSSGRFVYTGFRYTL